MGGLGAILHGAVFGACFVELIRCSRPRACFVELIRCSRPLACFVELKRRFPFSAVQVWAVDGKRLVRLEVAVRSLGIILEYHPDMDSEDSGWFWGGSRAPFSSYAHARVHFSFVFSMVFVLGPLGSLLGRLGALLGRSWAVLGRSWAVLGRSWGGLRWSWGDLGSFSAAPGGQQY